MILSKTKRYKLYINEIIYITFAGLHLLWIFIYNIIDINTYVVNYNYLDTKL